MTDAQRAEDGKLQNGVDSLFRKALITMAIEDAGHYNRDQRERIIAAYPEHEREARAHGVPIMGSGRVFNVPEADIRFDPFVFWKMSDRKGEPPWHYRHMVGIDFGINHPFAAVQAAYDADSDRIFIWRSYRIRGQTPIMHAGSLRTWGTWLPVAWPHDGLQRDKGSGLQLAQQYRDQDLNMHEEHATFAEGGVGTEAAVIELLDRMRSDRFKVAAHLGDWWEEFRGYHRKETTGEIVKERDDLMSATLKVVMMLRIAIPEPRAELRGANPPSNNIGYDVFR